MWKKEKGYMVMASKIFKHTESSFQYADVGVSQFGTSENEKFLEAERGGW